MRLHINVDHVATVRQARRTDEPDPVRAAVLAELGGADGITVHLREDRRHIQDRDLRALMETVRTGVNLELAVASDVLKIALDTKPMAVTLVPEKREEVTTEGGLALATDAQKKAVESAVKQLRDAGIRTSLFIGPDADAITFAGSIGADAVELHTCEYAEAWKQVHGKNGRHAVAEELGRLKRAAALGVARGVAVHAGHGLTYENTAHVASIMEIEELNIGHSIVSRALFVGMERAVRDMKIVITEARSRAWSGE
jgi:pyridoxine 5-phosphate synthase